jgi:hypothetical protein
MLDRFLKGNVRYFLVAVFIVLACAVFAHQALFTEANRFNSDDFGVNDAGLTYGAATDLYNPSEWPDLIYVLATNGESGYVFAEELEKASGSNMTLEELFDRQIEWERQSSYKFADLLNSHLGVATLEQGCGEKLEIFSLANRMNGLDVIAGSDEPEIARQELISQLKSLSDDESKFVSTLTDDSSDKCSTILLSEYISLLWDKSREINYITIPVYESDGITVIGEFEISM